MAIPSAPHAKRGSQCTPSSHFAAPGEAERLEDRRHVEAASEGGQGIFAVVGADHHDAEHRADEAERARHHGEEHHREGAWQGLVGAEEHASDDHRPEVLRGARLKERDRTTGAVPNGVAGQIGDRRGVVGVVLGEARLATGDVGGEIGGLGEGASSDLGEEPGERSPESVPGEHEGDGRRELQGPRGIGPESALVGENHREERGHAEDAHGDQEERRDGAPADGDLERLIQRFARSAGGPTLARVAIHTATCPTATADAAPPANEMVSHTPSSRAEAGSPPSSRRRRP